MEESHTLAFMRQDYLLRLIERCAALLRAMLAGRRDATTEEKRALAEEACIQHAGLRLDAAKAMSPEALREFLDTAGPAGAGRAVLLAEILAHDADLCEADGTPAAAAVSRLHAFCLLAVWMPFLTMDEVAHFRPKLERLADRLRELRDHPYVMDRLRAHGFDVAAADSLPLPSPP